MHNMKHERFWTHTHTSEHECTHTHSEQPHSLDLDWIQFSIFILIVVMKFFNNWCHSFFNHFCMFSTSRDILNGSSFFMFLWLTCLTFVNTQLINVLNHRKRRTVAANELYAQIWIWRTHHNVIIAHGAHPNPNPLVSTDLMLRL